MAKLGKDGNSAGSRQQAAGSRKGYKDIRHKQKKGHQIMGGGQITAGRRQLAAGRFYVSS